MDPSGRRRTGPARAWSPCWPSATAAWPRWGGWTGWGAVSASSRCASWARRGYVVTFRQTDPLFTLDLSDPAHPAVRGELEAPGLLVLPAPDRRKHAHRCGPGGRRPRARAGDPGVAVRRLRASRPRGASRSGPSTPTGPRPRPTTTPSSGGRRGTSWCCRSRPQRLRRQAFLGADRPRHDARATSITPITRVRNSGTTTCRDPVRAIIVGGTAAARLRRGTGQLARHPRRAGPPSLTRRAPARHGRVTG